MAGEAGLSAKYFCRFFSTITGKTPIEYLNYYRIEIASLKLVKNCDMSITDIALECGFNDVSYFIKTFKKYKNCTPNKYQKNYVNIEQPHTNKIIDTQYHDIHNE